MNRSTRDILDALADCLPEKAARIQTSAERDRVWFPKPAAADYGLYVETHKGSDGLLIGALPTAAPPGTFFWHLPLEYRREHEQEALRTLVDEARRLILNRSRVLQSLGLVLCHLRCEVEERGEWTRLGGTVATPRLFFMPPLAFRLKTVEYHSASVRSCLGGAAQQPDEPDNAQRVER